MAGFNWEDHAIEDERNPAAFNWDEVELENPPKVSQLESGVRGAAQGLSFGFADEATGALEAAKDFITNNPGNFSENYRKHRDESRAAYKAAEEANPTTYMTGQFAGGSAPALFSGGASIGALAAQGAAHGLGASDADVTQGDLHGATRDAVIGGSLGALGEAGGRLLGKIPLKGATNYISEKLGDVAENLAVKATGATGKQAERFAPNAGRELLDRGIVRFGQTAEDVAERAARASKQAGESISEALTDLDARGVTASVENVARSIQNKIKELSEVPGNEKIIRQLNNELDNLYERGASELPISLGEKAKRAYQSQTNYASPEAEKKASAQLARAFKEEVEQSALRADPRLAETFTKAKDTYSLLKPIQEASEKRASQLNQSPFGGFGDFAAAASGLPAGAGGSAAMVAARRAIAPRLASSGAVIADNISDVVKSAPHLLGKFAKPLVDAAERGGNSLAATHFVLQQTQPEYREMVLKSQDDQDLAQKIKYRFPIENQ